MITILTMQAEAAVGRNEWVGLHKLPGPVADNHPVSHQVTFRVKRHTSQVSERNSRFAPHTSHLTPHACPNFLIRSKGTRDLVPVFCDSPAIILGLIL